MFKEQDLQQEYKCEKCERYFIDEDIYSVNPCICKVCSQDEQ